MRKIMMLLCVLFVLMPTQAFAHSKLTESTPADNETVAISPEEIVLAFNTSISNISTFILVNENGEEQQIDDIAVNDNKLSGKVNAPLANGGYSVEWNIIGADGHAIEGSNSFVVQAAEATPEPEASSDPEQSEAIEPSSEPTATEQPQATEPPADNSDKESDSGTQIWPFIIIGIIFVVAIAVALRKRK